MRNTQLNCGYCTPNVGSGQRPISAVALVNGRVLTMDADRPIVSALLAVGERIVARGDTQQVRSAAPPGTKVVDLAGRAVVPGFIDAHCHTLQEGLRLQQVNVSPPGVMNVERLLSGIRERASRSAEGAWVIAAGYDHQRLAERRHPTIEELDRAGMGHPTLVRHTSGHLSVANTLALRQAGLDGSSSDPTGGTIVRDEHGVPTGLLLERAQQLVIGVVPAPSRAELVRAITNTSQQMATEGVTTIHEMSVGRISADEVGVWQELRDAGALRQNVRLTILAERLFERTDEAFGLGVRTGFGDDRLRIGGLKLFADGSLLAGTAALNEPFERTTERGMLVMPEVELRRQISVAHERGWQLAIHTLGDRAIAVVLDALETALREHPRAHRHRIEHCAVLTPELISRIVQLGALPVVQPGFISVLGPALRMALGTERAKLCYPLASLLRAGAHVAGSSDRPVVPGAPLRGIHDAVNEVMSDGVPYVTEERLSPMEALRLFTTGSAYAGFDENELGSLTPGKRADFVVLREDPTVVQPERIRDIPVDATFVFGEATHDAGL